jgi:glycosyltransferase involved in cell wall biosynthesis
MRPILVLTYWSYKDALIQSYTLPYIKIITKVAKRKVYLVCLEQANQRANEQERIEIQKELNSENIYLIFLEYNKFGLKQGFLWISYITKLISLILLKRIEYIHSWCTPAGAIGYILSVITGKPLILDSYEPHADSMLENGTWSKTSNAYRILAYLEKKQTERAIYYIGVASGMKEYAQKIYNVKIPDNQFFIKPACTDLKKFEYHEVPFLLEQELEFEHKIVCVYAGKLGGIYLDIEVFDFIKECYKHWGNQFRFIMLNNTSESEILGYIQKVGIPKEIIVQRFVPHANIPEYLSLASFAINPVKPIPSKRYCTPIKDGEYWAMGLPVVITNNISDDSNIIDENNIGYVLKDLNIVEYQNAIEKIEQLLNEDRSSLRHKIRKIAEKHRSFKIAEDVYQHIYGH